MIQVFQSFISFHVPLGNWSGSLADRSCKLPQFHSGPCPGENFPGCALPEREQCSKTPTTTWFSRARRKAAANAEIYHHHIFFPRFFFHSDFKPNRSRTVTSSFTFVRPKGRLTHTTCTRTQTNRRDFFDHLRSVSICAFRPFRNQFVPKPTHSWMVGNKYFPPKNASKSQLKFLPEA